MDSSGKPEQTTEWEGLPLISGPGELKDLVRRLVDMDAPDLSDDQKFIDSITNEQIEKKGVVGVGLVSLVRERIRQVPSPKGSKRFLLRSDFNESFLAYRIVPEDDDLGCRFFDMLQILTEKVLRDRHVFTEHWEELKSDLYIRALQAARRFDPEKGTPYTFFYRVIYRRVITLHERMLRDRKRYICYPHEQPSSPFSGTMAGPDEMLSIQEEAQERIKEGGALLRSVSPSKLEMTRTLFRNLLCWSCKPKEERRTFVKRNLPAYLDLMRENEMSRGEVTSLMSLFPPDEVAMADLGVRIEEFPIVSTAKEVENIDRLAPADFLRPPEPWAEEAIEAIQTEGRLTESALAKRFNVSKARFRKELERICKIRGIALHRDKEGNEHAYHFGVAL